MKHCENCGRDFETEQTRCPVCGCVLTPKEEDAEVVTTMMVMGLL